MCFGRSIRAAAGLEMARGETSRRINGRNQLSEVQGGKYLQHDEKDRLQWGQQAGGISSENGLVKVFTQHPEY